MSKVLLDPRTADRLAKIAGLFGSEHAGEQASAAARAHALLCRLNLTWADVISRGHEAEADVSAFQTDWRWMASVCGKNAHRCQSHETKFIRDMQAARRRPTEQAVDLAY